MAYIERKLVPTEVVEHINEYFKKHLPGYELLQVVRKSSHPDDSYLYMVSASNKYNETYAVWTCWNESVKDLNFGHYGILKEEDCEEVFKEHFYSRKIIDEENNTITHDNYDKQTIIYPMYNESENITVIFQDVIQNKTEKVISVEIVGFYYGSPDIETMEIFIGSLKAEF